MNRQKHEVPQWDHEVIGLSAKEREAQVFRELEAQQATSELQDSDMVVVLQSPDDRIFWERLKARWFFHCQRRKLRVDPQTSSQIEEPKWQGHWSITKYL